MHDQEFKGNKKLPFRIVAAHLVTDQSILSQTERGHRKISNDWVVKLADCFEKEGNVSKALKELAGKLRNRINLIFR
jgi:hypothetical protein